MEQALASANMVSAWKRVKANRGSAGVDGLTIAETKVFLQTHWPRIREALREGRYRPEPVRRVAIPKPGGGVRELGIPTVTDRLIQQALLQVLQPRIDPGFSDASHGFRPGRRAHDAVLQAQRHVQEGYRIVVDVDLEKFFDRVNHDVLMDRLAKRIDEKAVLRLIRRYLEAGILGNGVVMERHEGTPQGGPLSPLLANVMLDEVDRELEARIRRLTRRNGGRGLSEVAEQLRAYVPGWKAYFHLAQTPGIFRALDKWIRHRLRALQLKHWRRGTTVFRELRRLGATVHQAARVAANARRWWRTSHLELHCILRIAYFDRLGVPRLS